MLQKTYTVEPTQDGERSVTLRRVGDVQALAVAYHVPSGPHPDSAAVDVLGQVMADTPSGRLYKALVETKKATSVGDYFLFLARSRLPDASRRRCRQDASLEDAQKTMLATIDARRDDTDHEEEVERARTEMLKNIDLTLNSADRVGLELSEWIGAGRLAPVLPEPRPRQEADRRGRAARRGGVPQAVQPHRRRSSSRPRSPTAPTCPPSPDVAAMLKDYKGEAAVAQGEAFDPSPANIESRTTRTKLANGLPAGAAAQEDARRDRRRVADAALRRREEPRRTSRPPPTSPPTCCSAARPSTRASS